MKVTSSNIKEVLANENVVLDFWAKWCGPCKKLAPTIDELEKEYEGKVIFGKINIEDEEDLTSEYGIRNIPTVLFIKNGEVKDRTAGSVTKDVLKGKLNALL